MFGPVIMSMRVGMKLQIVGNERCVENGFDDEMSPARDRMPLLNQTGMVRSGFCAPPDSLTSLIGPMRSPAGLPDDRERSEVHRKGPSQKLENVPVRSVLCPQRILVLA